MDDPAIKKLREQINCIDLKLIALMEERMDTSRLIGKEKAKKGLPICDPARECELLSRNLAMLKNSGWNSYIKAVWEKMIECSKEIQEQEKKKSAVQTVAFQGIGGSYGETAAIALFGEEPLRTSMDRFEDVFEAVKSMKAEQGVVPVENSSTGELQDVFDLLRFYDLYITGETAVKIEHCLMGLPGSIVEEIQKVYSHPQALRQCSRFFREHPWMEPVPYANTAMAARDVLARGDARDAAIASRRAADLLGLHILMADIQDCRQNTTRFISVGTELQPVLGRSRTSILFTVRHVPGALYRILKPFYEHDINISRIESRPDTDKTFEYYFYIDFEGSTLNTNVQKTLEEVKTHCGTFRLLGSYPTEVEGP